MGILSFGFLSLAPLLGLGITSAHQARDNRISAQIAESLSDQAREGMLTVGTAYCNNEGTPCAQNGASYMTRTTLDAIAGGCSGSRFKSSRSPRRTGLSIMRWCFRRRLKIDPRRSAGFTVLEVLATLVVLLLILVALEQFVESIGASWHAAASDPFAEASAAFATVTQNLSVATLEPYRDYADATGAFRTAGSAGFMPYGMKRHSDLDFVCGPSGGTGVAGAQRSDDGDEQRVFRRSRRRDGDARATGHGASAQRAGLLRRVRRRQGRAAFLLGTSRLRWRLKQVMQPSDRCRSFPTRPRRRGSSSLPCRPGDPVSWRRMSSRCRPAGTRGERFGRGAGARLRLRFARHGNPLTLHQLPPRVHLALVAIDEASAVRLAARNGSRAPALVAQRLFQHAAQLRADLATLDASAHGGKIGHRIFQRDIALPAAAWSNTSP